jgi:hypothetical protein
VRGTLPSEVGEDGRRYVYIEAGRDEATDEVKGLVNAGMREDFAVDAVMKRNRISYVRAKRVAVMRIEDSDNTLRLYYGPAWGRPSGPELWGR